MNNFNIKVAAEALIDLALAEDQVGFDKTSLVALDDGCSSSVDLVAREPAILAGLELAKLIYLKLDSSISCDFFFKDGDCVAPGDRIAMITGPSCAVLSGERTVLNFIQRLSGIATVTNNYVAAVSNFAVDIVDTRKTTPGWRILEKYAVRCGGGVNHRFDLSDMIMFKDNHIALSQKSLPELIAVARAKCPQIPVACEADSLEQFFELLHQDLDIIMLDNMSLADMKTAVETEHGTIKIEATGGVDFSTVKLIAATGVNRISIGALTHSVKAIDLAFDII